MQRAQPLHKISIAISCMPQKFTAKVALILPEGRSEASPTAQVELFYVKRESITTIKIASSIPALLRCGYTINAGLTSVTIPTSVTSIGNSAFFGCESLISAVIPNSLTSIRLNAFYGCASLTSVAIPTSVTSIGRCAFDNCKDLKEVYYGGNEQQWKAIRLSANAFPESVTIHYNSTIPA